MSRFRLQSFMCSRRLNTAAGSWKKTCLAPVQQQPDPRAALAQRLQNRARTLSAAFRPINRAPRAPPWREAGSTPALMSITFAVGGSGLNCCDFGDGKVAAEWHGKGRSEEAARAAAELRRRCRGRLGADRLKRAKERLRDRCGAWGPPGSLRGGVGWEPSARQGLSSPR